MPEVPARQGLDQDQLRWILGLTRKLAAPFDLSTMLEEVVDAAKGALDAEGGTVWLYDAPSDELVLRVTVYESRAEAFLAAGLATD